jgi:hypothetical protein
MSTRIPASGLPFPTTPEVIFANWREALHASGSDASFLVATRAPVLERIGEPNRCILDPLKAQTPKTTLYLVATHGPRPLQVVCLGHPDFRLPQRRLESPSWPADRSPLTRANRGNGEGLGLIALFSVLSVSCLAPAIALTPRWTPARLLLSMPLAGNTPSDDFRPVPSRGAVFPDVFAPLAVTRNSRSPSRLPHARTPSFRL